MSNHDDAYDDDYYAELDEDDREPDYFEQLTTGVEDEESEYHESLSDYDEYRVGEFAEPLPIPSPGDEAGARNHFANLKRKYGAASFADPSPVSPLYMILMKLDSRDELADDADAHDDWLKRNKLTTTRKRYAARVAQEFENRLNRTTDAWDAVKASKYWRIACQPAKAIAITSGLLYFDLANPHLRSAVLTTLGGAFRDQGKLDDAENAGLQATETGQLSFHPHNLLGAVYYQKGNGEKGDEHFAIALKLGGRPESQEAEIKKSVRNAEKQDQRVVAQYLLQKDPIKYEWARKYVH